VWPPLELLTVVALAVALTVVALTVVALTVVALTAVPLTAVACDAVEDRPPWPDAPCPAAPLPDGSTNTFPPHAASAPTSAATKKAFMTDLMNQPPPDHHVSARLRSSSVSISMYQPGVGT
jgi:hypothetical protein